MSNPQLRIKNTELFECVPAELADLFSDKEYPWEIIGEIGKYLREGISRDGYYEIFPEVYVGRGVKISQNAEIKGPTFISDGAEIRTGAYIRGNVFIGKGCVVGNSTEVKNAILFDGANAPHYNYVGDSILGCRSHLGAGAVCSNLKADKSNVTVHADRDYATGLRKLGAILGDGADVGCGAVLNPGTVIGKGSVVYPNLTVRGTVPEGSIMKGDGTFVKIR